MIGLTFLNERGRLAERGEAESLRVVQEVAVRPTAAGPAVEYGIASGVHARYRGFAGGQRPGERELTIPPGCALRAFDRESGETLLLVRRRLDGGLTVWDPADEVAADGWDDYLRSMEEGD